MIFSRRAPLRLTLPAVCSLAVSCTSARVAQTAGADAPAGLVSDVAVSFRPGALDANGETDYRSNSISGTIRRELLSELRRAGKAGQPGAQVDFTVTDFRLRSGSAVFWFGVMAGEDRLAGTVTVRRGATVVKSFEASARGNESAWSAMALGRVKAGSRADLFCRLIARDIARQL